MWGGTASCATPLETVVEINKKGSQKKIKQHRIIVVSSISDTFFFALKEYQVSHILIL
jgi:hypothetical protein